MQKRKLAVVAFGMVAYSAVHAQSNVTLYGVADAGMVYTPNYLGSKAYTLTSGVASSSAFGLKGSEDLGGGNAAIFNVENGYNIATGAVSQNGTFFGRTAWVGLSGAPGAMTVGRQYSSAYWYTGYLTAGGSWAAAGAGFGAHPGDVDNLDTFNRVNNAIKYASPNFAGFSMQAMYGFGGKAGSFNTNSVKAVGAGYTNGPLTLGIGYQSANRPNFSLFGNKANDSATGINMTSYVDYGFASAGAQNILSFAGTYAVGEATIGLNYSNTRFTDLGTVAVSGLSAKERAFRGTEAFNVGEINFKYRFTPAWMLGTAWSYTRSSGATHAIYQQVDIALYYLLSKRTDLYAMGFYQHATGTDSRGLPAVANIAGWRASSTNTQTIATIGMRHRF